MFEYLIHSDNMLDAPELISGADTLEQARTIALREQERDPQRKCTITDRFGGTYPVAPRRGRPAKDAAEKAVRVNISLSPEALALIDAQDGNRSTLIEQMIVERWGHVTPPS